MTSSEPLNFLQSHLIIMVVHDHEPEYHGKSFNCCLQGQGHMGASHPLSVCPFCIFQTAELFATELGILVLYQEMKCHVKRLECYQI